MLVGPSGSGKSKIMDVLCKILTENGKTTRTVVMNPKAIRSEEMYGVKSDNTDDWISGVFSELWAKWNNIKKPQDTWIVCDGPVDAIWIEFLVQCWMITRF